MQCYKAKGKNRIARQVREEIRDFIRSLVLKIERENEELSNQGGKGARGERAIFKSSCYAL